MGNIAAAKQEARAALALAGSQEVQAISALALAMAGESAQATRLAGDLAQRYPQDTGVQFNALPSIRAAAALGRGKAGKAVEALAPAAPYELGRGDLIWLYPIYLRGQAYLGTREGTAAAAEFQKLLDHPGVVLNEPIGGLALLGLGRAYALAGDAAKSKRAYQDFFALWKDADADVPVLTQARLEYAHLR